MTREEAKEPLPIIQAFAEGKAIQFRTDNRPWVDLLDNKLTICGVFEYRIKPESQYRPFKSVKECLTEMLRHSDIGYVRHKGNGKKELFKVGAVNGIDYRYGLGDGWCGYTLAFEMFTFTDGEPFGIKEE